MPTAPPAEHVGAYVLEKELGRGAHGVVYRAHHRDRPDTPVALKVVESRGNLDRLLLEPAMLSQLDHPCIVGIEDYFLRGGDVVLALEFVNGEELQALLDRGVTFSQDEVHDFLLQMASALHQAHGKRIVHRDIKPSNVLVVRDGGRVHFVLTDFGIGQRAEGIQVEKHAGGTYLFMAPEQLRGRPGPQSDLWALGVVAYLLLTGKLPFPGPTLAELARQVLYAAPVPPSQCCPQPVDPQLEAVVLRLLDRSLQERVASAEELLRLLGHRGAPDTVLEQRPGRPAPAPAAARQSLDRQLDRGIVRRRRLLVLCIVLYLLPNGLSASGLLLVAGMLLFYKAQKEERWTRNAAALGTLAAVLLLVGSFVLRSFFPLEDRFLASQLGAGVGRLFGPFFAQSVAPQLGPAAGMILLALLGLVLFAAYLGYIFLPVIAGALFGTLRRLQRDRVLRDAAGHAGADADRYLQALRDSLDSRFEDVGLHLKYAEALFARGRVTEAAVEARLLLGQDPYHFNGNLLLANAYHALGLAEDCVAVCDRYLEVTGYCFEFGELRDQSRRRLGQP
jgi:serine/threonine-protein kinase